MRGEGGGICLVLGSAVCPGERGGGDMFSIGFGGMSGGEERGGGGDMFSIGFGGMSG